MFICILIPVSLQFVPEGAVVNNLALVQEMAWHFTGNKPLPQLALTKMSEAIWWHQATMI